MQGDIDIEAREDGLAWITVCRPDKHNALARPLLEALAAAVREARSR